MMGWSWAWGEVQPKRCLSSGTVANVLLSQLSHVFLLCHSWMISMKQGCGNDWNSVLGKVCCGQCLDQSWGEAVTCSQEEGRVLNGPFWEKTLLERAPWRLIVPGWPKGAFCIIESSKCLVIQGVYRLNITQKCSQTAQTNMFTCTRVCLSVAICVCVSADDLSLICYG